MKSYVLSTFIILSLLIFMPLAVLFLNNNMEDQETILTYEITDDITDKKIRLYCTDTKETLALNMNEYICSVVAAQMPHTYNSEALKAQAVVAYTYTLWTINNSDTSLYDITDDENIHQKYLSSKELKEKWGENFDSNYKKIEKIVNTVSGEYIAYNGQPIKALSHQLSAGETCDYKNFSDSDFEYLKSVNAPGDNLSPNQININLFTYEEFISLIKDNLNIDIDNLNEENPIEIIKADENGYVLNVKIMDKTVSGEEIQNLFSLRSTNFKVTTNDTQIQFTTYGIGHGFGMSRNSADFMARQNLTYDEIIKHFYNDCVILKK